MLLFVRAVGLDEYGKFALWVALISMAGGFCGSWMNQAQLRFASMEKVRDGAWSLAIIVAMALSVLASVACVFFVLWLRTGAISLDVEIFTYGLLCTATVIHAARITALQASMQARQVLTIEILRGILGLMLPLGVAWGVRQDHVGLMAGLTVAYAVAVGQSWFSAHGGRLAVKFDVIRVQEILGAFWRFGWRLSIFTGIMLAFPVVDRYLIQHFLGYGATGQYAALYDLIVRSYSLLFFPVVLAAHPRIMAAANAGHYEESDALIRHAMVIQLGLFSPVFIILALGGRMLIDAVLPGNVGVPLEMVLLLALSGFLWQIALLVHKPLEIKGRVDIMLLALGGALLVNAIVGAWGATTFWIKCVCDGKRFIKYVLYFYMLGTYATLECSQSSEWPV